MKIIESSGCPVYFSDLKDSPLSVLLSSPEFRKSRKFVLVDENTLQHCFPKLVQDIPELSDAEIIEVDSGEQNKTIEICSSIWEALNELHADRSAVFINLGGGVITDMGGFIASTYKRGIPFINIPTTLLAQVDASVGGKVGVDLAGFKNMVGLFSYPLAVYIDNSFLLTLPKREVLSGFAEMVKHALIADADYWDTIVTYDLSKIASMSGLVHRSVQIKNDIVLVDPTEKGKRKLLNFGHTIGHAIESLSLESERKILTHGEAIAIGMICESWLSYRHRKLTEAQFLQITDFISGVFPFWKFDQFDFHRLLELMKGDKKNQLNKINFTLLDGIGKGVTDCHCNADEIKESLRFYLTFEHHAG